MCKLPLFVTIAQSSAFSGVGFGIMALRVSPFVDSSKAEFVDPDNRL